MKQTTLKINQLTCENCNCGHCGQPILFLLKGLFGIMSVKEDFDQNTVDITYEDDVINITEILSILHRRGYEAYML
ncbi:MAG: heavy-metal-associated domain-containing protein [Acholeplasmataceae bacterium]|jgi:copper chaperone CopZ|nr:heavy-metal-associated domain-containing protein [Acholeplasmataceae bacterium]